jgi:hypothetical protein
MSLTVELRQKASDGDIESLETVLGICTGGLKHSSMYLMILDIVLSNFQPARYPESSPIKLTNGEHRMWMKKLLLAFHIFNVSSDRTYCQHGRLDPMPESVRHKVRQQWPSRIWPCFNAIVDVCVLDDSQPPVDQIYHSQISFSIVCAFLHVFMWPSLAMDEIMPATKGFRECMARLLLRCLTRHRDQPKDIRVVLHLCAGETPEVVSVLNQESDFAAPVLLGYLRYLENTRSEQNSDATEVLVQLNHTILTFFKISEDLFLIVWSKYPELFDVSLRLLKNCLDVNSGFIASGSIPSINRNRYHWAIHEAVISLTLLSGVVFSNGGTYMRRRGIRKHFLQMVLKACSQFKDYKSHGFSHAVPSYFEILSQDLIHLSVLGPTIHALKNIEENNLDPDAVWGVSQRDEEMKSAWKRMRLHATERKQVLQEYKLDCIPNEPPLCGNGNVSSFYLLGASSIGIKAHGVP